MGENKRMCYECEAQEGERFSRTQHDAKLEIESHCLELDAQNKRYLEALEQVEMVTNYEDEANEIASKALEGESE